MAPHRLHRVGAMKKPQSHADFLTAVFHAAEDNETGCIATLLMSEGKATYPAYPWPTYKTQDFHTHYGVGLHVPRDPKIKDRCKFRRTKDTWTGTAVIVLDDVGEEKEGGPTIKVPDLEPSFIVQTKPGSQQWGYILDTPIRDYARARLIQTAAAQAGINDPGGQNPARLVRLPGSKPPGKKHVAKLVAWSGKHFIEDEIIDGLNLDLAAAKTIVRATSKAGLTDGDVEPVNIGDDPVLAWLDEKGMILGDSSHDGWIEIICPWHKDHTDEAIYGTGYKPPTDTDPYRSFHCFHRCSSPEYGRNTEVFLDWVRKSGGPDCATLDESHRKAKIDRHRELRRNARLGTADPVLMEHVREARTAKGDDLKRRVNSIIWLLTADGWGDAEIIRVLINLRVMGADLLAGVKRTLDIIDSCRRKQAANARRDAERHKRKPLAKEERIERFMKSYIALTNSEREAAIKWLEDYQ